jgi:3-oxoacyl-[acyl-carrier-protein] synthase II
VFGERAGSLPLADQRRSMTGHMMGAAGAFEAFATVMSVAEQTVPARSTIAIRSDCDLWVVDDRPMPVRYALSNNIGLGGTTARSSSRLDGTDRRSGGGQVLRDYNPLAMSEPEVTCA